MSSLIRITLQSTLILSLPGAVLAQAQDSSTQRADSALASCLAATSASGSAAAESSAKAEQLWRAEVGRRPAAPAAHVGLARVLIQCRLRSGGMTDQAALFEETVGELQRAIALDPAFWPARFTLGMVFAGAPSFMGQSANAIVQLERATAADGIPPAQPELAVALARLGELYAAAGRSADAVLVRSRGAALFPNDARFGGTAKPPASPSPPGAERRAGQLGEITVTVVAPEAQRRRGGRSMSSIDIVTAPGGTADLQQALQTLPGVTGGSESSDLVLRGGDPEESAFYLNGARLSYAGKFESLNGGLFGVIDPSVLRSARVLAGGFSARFGDALSGVIEAEAMGAPGGKTWRAGINSAGLSGTVSRPLGSGYGAWASLRATHTGLLLRLQNRRADFASVPVSLEGMLSATRTLPNGELQAVVLVEHDAASPLITAGGYRGPYDAAGTTASGIASGRLTNAGPFATVRFNLAASSRRTTLAFGALQRTRVLRRIGARVEGDWIATGTILVHGGLEVARLAEAIEGTIPTSERYDPGAPTHSFTGAARSADHLGSFGEAMLAPNDWLSITAGLRLDRLPGESSLSLDPRLELSARTGSWSFTLGSGVFRQGRFRLTPDQPGADDRTGVARRAEHLLIGIERQGRTTLRADFYAKRYADWVDGTPEFTPTSGRVLGADLFLHIPGSTRSGRITYSVMRGRLSLPDGSSISSAYDVSQSLVTVGTQRFGRDWELGATGRLSAGRPFTAVVGVSTNSASPGIAPVLGAPNSERFPTFARLDTRLSRYARVGDGLLVLFAEVLNVTGRGNVAAYGYDASFTRRTPIRTFFGRRTVVLGADLRY